MKKYLSCIILIVLCIVCVAVFYVNANDFESSTPEGSTQGSSNGSYDDDNVNNTPLPTIDKTGTITSERLSDTNLRIEWAIFKLENDSKLYLSAEVYLDTPEQITNAGSGYILVNGVKEAFFTKTMIGTSNLLTSYSTVIEAKGNDVISFDAYLDITSYTQTGDKINGLHAIGTVLVSEEYMKMASNASIDLELISKFPELPSGDEITALCMVLNYLKHDVDKCDLSDLYLSKGPAHYTDIFEANAGNPKDTYNSYGCMPPVIVNAANKYIGINGGSFLATDVSGYNVDMLYYEVSQGNPVIVWACEEFDSTPSVFRTLIIDGKATYLKSNVNTLVLIGYDLEKGTVTLANPSGNIFDINMELFEKRFSEVGSYAVLIK